MLELLSHALSEDRHKRETRYRLRHTRNGRRGTTLTLDVSIAQAFDKTTATIVDLAPEVDGDGAAASEEALDKLADWLERAAIAIRARGAPTPAIFRYDDPVSASSLARQVRATSDDDEDDAS